jgi:cytochrome c-type biogenesis protein CcmF
VVEKREALKSWTILLAILAFGFSLIGTFIVRSGVLTSVHAFANDPERGVFILFILAFFMGGALTLFAARASAMEAKGVFGVVSRESALVFNNILLAVAAFVVFFGTLWPLMAEMFFDRKLSVGAPFFNMAFTPFMVVLGALLPFGSMLSWKRANGGRVAKSLVPLLVLAVAVGALAYAMQTERTALGPIGLLLGTWMVSGAAFDLWGRTGRSGNRFARLFRLPGADWGKAVAHAGLGITFIGIAGLMAWDQEDIRVVNVGEPFELGGYQFVLSDVQQVQGPNYISTTGVIELGKDGRQLTTLYPEKRVYPVAQMPTTEAAIDNGFLRDIYVVIGDPQADGGWAVRTYIKPLANWIWAGSIIMALGGCFSLADRRFRVAAGARKTAMKGVPAE